MIIHLIEQPGEPTLCGLEPKDCQVRLVTAQSGRRYLGATLLVSTDPARVTCATCIATLEGGT